MSIPKIFGIGLSRTGTTSLTTALQALGIRAIHWPVDHGTLADVRSGRWKMGILSHHDAVVDCALPIIGYKRYADLYPGSRFILTVRDLDEWIVSITRHWQRADKRFDWWRDVASLPPHAQLAYLYRLQVFGQLGHDPHHFRTVFERHWDDVLLAFRKETSRLLVYDVRDGWEPLCRFLSKSIPDTPFPWENKGVA